MNLRNYTEQGYNSNGVVVAYRIVWSNSVVEQHGDISKVVKWIKSSHKVFLTNVSVKNSIKGYES